MLEKVQTDIFNLSLKLIESNQEIGLITFNKRNLGAVFPTVPDYDNSFIELKNNIHNRTNVLVGLWRRDCYIKLIVDGENPWEYEKNSNLRSKYAGFKIYTQNYEASFPAFRYCMNPKDGYGITGRKWLNKNKAFFESKGIFNVNYNNLGIIEETITYESIQKENRELQAKNKLKQKEQLKNQSFYVRIREFLYEGLKRIRKSVFVKKSKYILLCVKYYFYYKKMNKNTIFNHRYKDNY